MVVVGGLGSVSIFLLTVWVSYNPCVEVGTCMRAEGIGNC